MENIQIILGSTRKGRLGEKVAKWVFDKAKAREDFKSELVDLKDWPLPFFEESVSPAMVEGNYPLEIANNWSKKISEADGFVILTPEYNHGYPAVLKNALDYLYKEWVNKPVAFVSYGGPAGGARAVEQLRQVVIELQMAPIREAIHLTNVWEAFDDSGSLKNISYNDRLDKVFDQLIWWTKTLKKGNNP